MSSASIILDECASSGGDLSNRSGAGNNTQLLHMLNTSSSSIISVNDYRDLHRPQSAFVAVPAPIRVIVTPTARPTADISAIEYAPVLASGPIDEIEGSLSQTSPRKLQDPVLQVSGRGLGGSSPEPRQYGALRTSPAAGDQRDEDDSSVATGSTRTMPAPDYPTALPLFAARRMQVEDVQCGTDGSAYPGRPVTVAAPFVPAGRASPRRFIASHTVDVRPIAWQVAARQSSPARLRSPIANTARRAKSTPTSTRSAGASLRSGHNGTPQQGQHDNSHRTDTSTLPSPKKALNFSSAANSPTGAARPAVSGRAPPSPPRRQQAQMSLHGGSRMTASLVRSPYLSAPVPGLKRSPIKVVPSRITVTALRTGPPAGPQPGQRPWTGMDQGPIGPPARAAAAYASPPPLPAAPVYAAPEPVTGPRRVVVNRGIGLGLHESSASSPVTPLLSSPAYSPLSKSKRAVKLGPPLRVPVQPQFYTDEESEIVPSSSASACADRRQGGAGGYGWPMAGEVLDTSLMGGALNLSYRSNGSVLAAKNANVPAVVGKNAMPLGTAAGYMARQQGQAAEHGVYGLGLAQERSIVYGRAPRGKASLHASAHQGFGVAYRQVAVEY